MSTVNDPHATGDQAARAALDAKVDHPAHYGGAESPYEVIKVLVAWLSPDALLGFCLANAIKYIARSGKKQGESTVADLRKARWYLDYAITQLEKR